MKMVSPASGSFFTEEFKLSSLLFNTESPLLLGTPQIGKWQRLYIIYRAIWAVWWIGFVIYDAYGYVNHPDSFYTYMSNWMIVILLCSSVSQFFSSVYCHIHRTRLRTLQQQGCFTCSDGTPWLLKINWFLYDMASPVALFISVVYFTAIHTIQKEEQITISTICVHLVNSIYVLIDLCIVAVPFRIMHFWLPEIFGITYTFFSVLYWGVTGADPIYHILDYENSPGLSAVYLLCVAFIASPLFHCLTFCLYWLRLLVYNQLCGIGNDEVQCNGEETDKMEEGKTHTQEMMVSKYKVRAQSQESVTLTVKS